MPWWKISWRRGESLTRKRAIAKELKAKPARGPKGERGMVFKAKNQREANRRQEYAARLAKQKTVGKE